MVTVHCKRCQRGYVVPPDTLTIEWTCRDCGEENIICHRCRCHYIQSETRNCLVCGWLICPDCGLCMC